MRRLFLRLTLATTLAFAALAGCSTLDEQQRRLIFQPSDRSWWGGASAAEGMSEVWIEYAAEDTRHLTRLADWLGAELAEAGRMAWASEECRALEDSAGAPPEAGDAEDPVMRIRGSRNLSPRQLAALREAHVVRA